MTREIEEKTREIAKKYFPVGSPHYTTEVVAQVDCQDAINEMAEWKDHNPSEELIEKICKLCDAFDKDAPWQSACWCEHAEEDDWEAVYSRRIQFIKKHLNDKK